MLARAYERHKCFIEMLSVDDLPGGVDVGGHQMEGYMSKRCGSWWGFKSL